MLIIGKIKIYVAKLTNKKKKGVSNSKKNILKFTEIGAYTCFQTKFIGILCKKMYLCGMIKTLAISLPMLVCIFWSVLLLLDWWEQRTQAKARMVVFMVVAAILYGCHFIFFNHLYGWMPVTDVIYCMTNLSVFPLYYLYIKEVTEEHSRKHWQVTLLIPALLAGLTTGALYLFMDEPEEQLFIEKFLYQGTTEGLCGLTMIQAIVHICIKIIFALQIPPILVKGIKKIKRYDKMVETNYADTDLRKMHMAKSILALFIVASIISFTANIMGKEYFDKAPWLVLIPAATFFTLLFLLGYAGHKQNFTIQCLILETTNDIELPTGTEDVTTEMQEEEVNEEVTEATEKTNEAIEAAEEEKQGDRIERLRKKIIETIDTERLFLQQDLKINDIAKLLHTNRDYIYQAINVRMGMSFSEYINRLRVDYAAQLMEKNPKMPTNEVAFRSGFSSLASFYRNFKAYKDCPPLTYKKESTSQD